MPKKIELLAPAGNMQALQAAVAAGCDAVYLGGTSFSARAFAGNFDHEEMQAAIRYCHIHDVKVYVTLNTLLTETELENAKKEVRFLYESGADALLVQDLGLFSWVHAVYPDFPLHCSTQMHIHNRNGVRFMKEQGADRIVLARECDLEQVRACAAEGIDIEVFVYGAVCISYSGQCLMSAAMRDRSGNRGVCAQMCRLRYQHPAGRLDGQYLLSPRDLNVIDRVPEIIEAGACSLKIEGRMKRPEYVWLIVSCFRQAIDACYAGQEFHLTDEQQKDLLLMFNRTFSEGHLFDATPEQRMNHYRPNHMGVTIGTVEQFQNGRVQVHLSDALNQHDGLRILNEPHDTGLTAVRIEKNGLLVSHAGPGDHVWLDCRSKPVPRPGQKLQKTSDAKLLEQIDQKIAAGPQPIPLRCHYELRPEQPLRLTLQDADGRKVEVCSAQKVQLARTQPLQKRLIEASLAKTGDSAYVLQEISGTAEQAFLPVSQINETRRLALQKMDDLRACRRVPQAPHAYHVNLVQKPAPAARRLLEAEKTEKPLPEGSAWISSDPEADYGRCPVVNQQDVPTAKQPQVLSQLGDFWTATGTENLAGMSLNCTNSCSAAFLLSQPSVCGIILSSELQEEQIRDMLEAFRKRYHFTPVFYQLVYGRRTLMYIKDGIAVPPCTEIRDDQGTVYPVRWEGQTMELLEPEPVRQRNTLCYGDYVILPSLPVKE